MNTSLPKVLVGFKGKPLIQHLLDAVSAVPTEHKPVIVVGHKYELIQSYLGPNFIYAFQEGQFGTAHAVSTAKSKIDGDNVLVLNGDSPFTKPASLASLIKRHEETGAMFSMLTAVLPNFENEYSSFLGFGRIVRDSNGKLKTIREFVDANDEEKEIREVNSGIYSFNSKWLWEHLEQVQKNKHGEYYLTDLVEIAVKEGLAIANATIDPLEVFGINTPEQLKQAETIV